MSQVTSFGTGGSGGGIQTIDGDTGSVTGLTVGIKGLGSTSAGSTVHFVANGTTLELQTTDSNGNVIIGLGAGNGTISGTANAGVGNLVLAALTSGSGNVALAQGALQQLTSGSFNTAFSNIALNQLKTGSGNVALGFAAGYPYTGAESYNIIIGGSGSGTGVVGESNVLRIGGAGTGTGNFQLNKAFISGIRGITPVTAGTYPVVIDPNGQLGAPLPVSFQAFLPTEDANATGNGTTYILGTVTPLTLSWNDGSGMNTNGTFTAPSDGVYVFNLAFFIRGSDVSHTTLQGAVTINNGTPGEINFNLAYQNAFVNAAAGGFLEGNGSVVWKLNTGDLVNFKVIVSGGTQTVDIYSGGNGLTYVSGYKVF